MKRIVEVVRGARMHWVGDGFPVRSLVSYPQQGSRIDPFLLLDYARPAEFPPSDEPRGVEMHPHRGFETVTLVYQGELEHRDTAGHQGKIGPGDVQWMTAAGGVLHEEMHGRDFTRSGGTLEMVQLWVNLPAEHKMSPPRYQEILAGQIPETNLSGNSGRVRVIAGEFEGVRGPAQTFTPLDVWDLDLSEGSETEISFPDGFTALVLLLRGEATVNGTENLKEAELALFGREGEKIGLKAGVESKLLVLAGQPIDEPVVVYGPFAMNTEEEIQTAIQDFRAGRF